MFIRSRPSESSAYGRSDLEDPIITVVSDLRCFFDMRGVGMNVRLEDIVVGNDYGSVPNTTSPYILPPRILSNQLYENFHAPSE